MSSLSEQLNQYLTSKGSPLASYTTDFIKAGQRYGVDPRFLVAIAGAETEFGKTGNAGAINNPFGWGPHIRFPNYSAAINTIAKGLTTGPYYKTKGRTTIPQIGATWAPSGAANDPTNLNSNWVRNVSGVYRELGGNPGANVFSNSPAISTSSAGPVNSRHQASPPVQLPDATGSVSGVNWQKLYAIHKANQKDILAGRAPSPQRMQKMLGMIQGAIPVNIPEVPSAAGVPGVPTGVPDFQGLASGGGPSAHHARALGNWQSDDAYDLMGKAGQAIPAMVNGTVVKISGQPGGNPGFAGYGITVRTKYGDLFYKHLGTKNVKVGQRINPRTIMGTLDPSTAGGPHLHLGGQDLRFLAKLAKTFSRKVK